jgi:hypothetical protein
MRRAFRPNPRQQRAVELGSDKLIALLERTLRNKSKKLKNGHHRHDGHHRRVVRHARLSSEIGRNK